MLENNSKRNSYIKMALIAVAVILFGLLLKQFDFNILFFIQKHIRNDVLNKIVPFYTTLGDDGIIWIALGIVLLIPKKTRKCGIMVLAALIVMVVTNNIILKNVIARPRPYATHPELIADIKHLIHVPSSYSFPSGHTVSSMAVAFTVLTQHKKFGIVTLVFATLMGLSRLYVGVHFPTDVYGGIIVGAAIALFVWYAEKKISPIIIQKFRK